MTPTTKRQHAVFLASRPDGVSNRELQIEFGCSEGPVGSILHVLRQQGLVHKGGTRPCRYFTDAKAAAAYKTPYLHPARVGVAKKPVVMPAGEAIETDRTRKITLPGATVDTRYQVEPGTAVVGAGFSKLNMGQYLAPAHCAAARAVAGEVVA